MAENKKSEPRRQKFFPVEATGRFETKPAGNFNFDLTEVDGVLYSDFPLSGTTLNTETGLDENYWEVFRNVHTPDGKIFFNKWPRDVPYEKEVFSEVFTGLLAKKLGISSVEYFVVNTAKLKEYGRTKRQDKRERTLLSTYAYDPENENYFNLIDRKNNSCYPDGTPFPYSHGISLAELYKTLENLVVQNKVGSVRNIEDIEEIYGWEKHVFKALNLPNPDLQIDKNLKKDLFKVYLFDMITIQTDRAADNLGFKFNKATNTIGLASMFDSALIAGASLMCMPEDLQTQVEQASVWSRELTAKLFLKSRRFGLENPYDRYAFSDSGKLSLQEKLFAWGHETAKQILNDSDFTAVTKEIYSAMSKGDAIGEAVAETEEKLQNYEGIDFFNKDEVRNIKNGAYMALGTLREALHSQDPKLNLPEIAKPNFPAKSSAKSRSH